MRRIALSLVSLVCLFGITVPLFQVGATSVNARPLNPKYVQELTPNVEPNANLFTCTPGTYLGGDAVKLEPVNGCIYHASFGDWDLQTGTRYVYIGPRGGFPMVSSIGRFLPPTSNPEAIVGLYYSSKTGSFELAKYTITDSDMTLQKYWSASPGSNWQYSLQPVLAKALTYPGSTWPLSTTFETVGFSPNGQWMAIKVKGSQGTGIAVVDVATFTPKVVSWDPNFQMSVFTSGTFVRADTAAVSNDGKYVAVTGSVGTKLQLRVYDASTCTDQSGNYGSSIKNCTYGDVWNGTYPSGLGAVGSVKASFSGTEYPRRISFTADGRITFQSIHDRVSSSSFGVAQYSVANVMSEASVQETMLALGDSYISGEGAYSYVSGTDTSDNKCHQSYASYPYILGSQLFGEGNYHSVACSGATTVDILNDTDYYLGQTKEKVEWKFRDQTSVKSNHLPGYANQLRFITQDNPNVVLLSIGGNDVHFADIVTLCVLNSGADSCFSTRSEREQLLKYVYSRHADLTQTYAKILENNPKRRLYVMGYPQIISTSGACGLNVHFDDSERQFGSLLIDRINATIKNAAESVGAEYVDISHSLDGHRLCEATPDGANGLTAGNDKLILGNESYHPTALGHSLIAADISTKTSALKDAMPTPSGTGQLSIDESDTFLATSNSSAYNTVRKLFFAAITPIPYAAVMQQMSVSLNTKLANIPDDQNYSGQNYEIVLYSDEVKIGEGEVSTEGTIDTTITVPRLPYGAHTLHIFITGKDGTPLDIMQVVYIGVNSQDIDGDGIIDAEDPEPFINETGKIVGELPVVITPVDGGNKENTKGDSGKPVPDQMQTGQTKNSAGISTPIPNDVTQVYSNVISGSSNTETLGSGVVLDAFTGSGLDTSTIVRLEKAKKTRNSNTRQIVSVLLTTGVIVAIISFILGRVWRSRRSATIDL